MKGFAALWAGTSIVFVAEFSRERWGKSLGMWKTKKPKRYVSLESRVSYLS